MDKAVESFKDLGYSLTKEAVFDEYRQVWISFLEKNGYVVELVSPVTKDSIVAGLLKRQGNAPYHICYETDNFNEDLSHMLEQHYVPCNIRGGGIDIKEAPAIEGRRCCFLISPHMGMVELLEGEIVNCV